MGAFARRCVRSMVGVLAAALCLHLLSAVSAAQTAGRNRALGAAAGVASGVGFSYRQVAPEKIGFQVAFIGWKTGDGHFVSIGVQPMYVIDEKATNRLYIVGGVGIFSTEDDTDFNIGVGLGIEYFEIKNVGASLEAVLTYLSNGNIIPLPQLAILYYF